MKKLKTKKEKMVQKNLKTEKIKETGALRKQAHASSRTWRDQAKRDAKSEYPSH